MDIKLEDLTLKQLTEIEQCIYNSEYEFTDSQFREFVENQLEFGLDLIQLEIQEEIIYIYETIYFFEDLISKGDYVER
jgi:hypothetical protein